MSAAAEIAAREMHSDVLDIALSLARDLAEQVFTLCCARAGVSQAEQDRLFDRAEEILVDAVRDLCEAARITDPAALQQASACAAEAFVARTVELCVSRHGGDMAQ